VFYLLLAGAVIRLAVTRWNGVPADPRGPMASGTFGPSPPIDPGLDRTEALVAAFGALPPPPALVLPAAPAGMRWKAKGPTTIDVSDALNGEWDPETRPHLQGVIAFLETPALQAAMSRIASIEAGGWRPFGPQGRGLGAMGPVRQVTRLFVARARYHHAGLGDVDAALADLAAAYRLAGITFDSGEYIDVLTAMACAALTDGESRRLAGECSLTPAQAAGIIGAIQAFTPDLPEMWRIVTAAHLVPIERKLDLCWTDDGQGNGWLVLSHLDDMWAPNWAPRPRCGAWNLLSPLYNDRRTVAGKIARLGAIYERVGELAYAEALSTLEAAQARPAFNLADGPLALAAVLQQSRAYELVVRNAAWRRGTILAVGLSAYRHAHGGYPASLAPLLDGGYVASLPLDPYVDEPLRYRREDDRFVLYSVGPDGIDDGGRKHDVNASAGQIALDGDWVFPRPRRKPYCEPELEEVEP
jgi:hypothetical protein